MFVTMNRLDLKLIFWTSLLTVLIIVAYASYKFPQERQALMRQMDAQGGSLTYAVSKAAVGPILYDDIPALQSLAESLIEKDNSVAFIRIRLADEEKTLVTEEFASSPDVPSRAYREQIEVSEDYQLGTVEIGILTAPTEAMINERMWSLVIASSLIILMKVITEFVVIGRMVRRPLGTLAVRATQLGQGDLETVISLPGHDELVLLADTLDGMRCNLQTSYNKIQHQNDELKELDRLKDDFLANVTHELKTPLNGILGLGHAILDGAYGTLDEEFRKPIGQIVFSADRLLKLALQILAFAPDKQATTANIQEVSLQEHLDAFFSQFAGQAIEKGICVACQVDAALSIPTDPEHLDTVLMNLVGNAVKFTHEGYVRLIVYPLGTDAVAFSVKDTGIGIPEAFHQKIFERFQQGFASESRAYEGSGLGLSIMKQSLGVLKGAIHMESVPGVGSVFTVILPWQKALDQEALLALWLRQPVCQQLAASSHPPTQTSTQHTPVPQAVATQEPASSESVITTQPQADEIITVIQSMDDDLQASILVVDDDAINREVLRANLNRNFRVVEAEDGHQCLEKIGKNQFDLVLLDLMMPGISGYDVLAILQKSVSEPTSPPVIVLSAKDQTSAMTKAFHMGAVDYVTKPFQKEELMARIRAHVTLRRNATEIINRKLAETELLEKKGALERSNRFIRKTFGRYMSDEVVESILDTPEGLRLGGEKKEVTVVMTDLRGFTSIGERMPSEQVISMLNMYLEVMTEIIMKYNGTIIEFLGDGILALFGAPVTREDDAQRAVACVLEMQKAMPSVNAKNRQHGFPEVEMGAGINTGPVVAGNIGSEKRSKYGVVGKTINLASRIESFTVGGQILVSESTLQACNSLLRVDDQLQVSPKGVSEPITIYHIGGIDGPHQVHLPLPKETVLYPLPDGPPVKLSVLEGKQSVRVAHKGRITAIGASSAEITTSLRFRRLTNLQMELFDIENRSITTQLYGKVLTVDEDNNCLRVHFTSIPPNVKLLFQQWLDLVSPPEAKT